MRTRFIFLYGAVALAFVADRILKYFFVHYPAVSYGGDFFISLRLAMNPGIAFGFQFAPLLITSGTMIAILILFWWWTRELFSHHLGISICIAFMIVGATSNILDRFLYHAVIDYIDVRWFTVFNIADSMITIGACGAMIVLWQVDKKLKFKN